MAEIKIKQQARQSLAMKVTPNGVEVLIPHQLDPDSDRVRSFIDEGLQKLSPPVPPTETLTRAEIVGLVERLAAELGVTVSRVQLRRMRQKWGSISTAGTLTLADDLVKLSHRLVEYVIWHELLHLKIPHHNRLYYLLLEQYVPDWRNRERELVSYMGKAEG